MTAFGLPSHMRAMARRRGSMTAAKVRRVCHVCRYDNSWHYDEDGNATRCPNWLSAQHAQQMAALTAEQRRQAKEAARLIVRDFAETRYAFSANDARAAFDAAQIPTSLIGAAFNAAKRDGLIVKSGRYVQSTDSTTRHEIPVWDSRVYRRAAS